MMKPIRIAFDMDGVLVDFERGIKDAFGAEYPKEHLPDEEFYAWRESLFDKIGNKGVLFWESLPRLPGYLELYKEAKSITHDIRFITAWPKAWTDFRLKDQCRFGKKAWLLRHLGFDASMRINMSYAHEKYWYCESDRYFDVLIDDRDSTIEEWNSAGGHAIHYTSFESAMDGLKDIKILKAKGNIL